MKLVFDTSVWRALGIKGCESLRAKLADQSSSNDPVEIWECVPVIFETTWDWLKEKKPWVAAAMAEQKLAIVGTRIVPSPRIVIQRAIADAYGLPRPSSVEEVALGYGLLTEMKDEEFLNSERFSSALISSIKESSAAYAAGIELFAEFMEETFGPRARLSGVMDLVMEIPQVESEFVRVLADRFSLPESIRATVPNLEAWRAVGHADTIIDFYAARLQARLELGIKAKSTDFLDLEIAICGTRMDKLVTQNTKDFQRYDIPGMREKLWTLDDLKDCLSFS